MTPDGEHPMNNRVYIPFGDSQSGLIRALREKIFGREKRKHGILEDGQEIEICPEREQQLDLAGTDSYNQQSLRLRQFDDFETKRALVKHARDQKTARISAKKAKIQTAESQTT